MRPDSIEMKEIRLQMQRQDAATPYWDDVRALEEMWEFCAGFPQGTSVHSAAAWTQSYLRSRRRLPPPDLRARLIQAALKAGWKPGVRSVWDLDELPDSWWA